MRGRGRGGSWFAPREFLYEPPVHRAVMGPRLFAWPRDSRGRLRSDNRADSCGPQRAAPALSISI